MKKIRFGVILLLFVSSFSIVGFHLYELQIREGVIYAARAESQYRHAGFLRPERGTIYFTDKNGNDIPAALNREYPVVFAVPTEIARPEELAKTAAALLGLDEGEVRRKFLKRSDSYEVLVSRADLETVRRVKEAKLPGVYLDVEQGRLYPFGTLAAHVVGFVGSSNKDDEEKGRYGTEAYEEDRLNGEPGTATGNSVVEPVSGASVRLTIDRNIQARAEELLGALVGRYRATGGTVIVEEVRTGRILALGSEPTFDPNRYGTFSVETFLNPAVQTIYEPGSVFKVVTLSAGLDSGKITPETSFTDTGSLTLDGKTIKNAEEKVYGRVTVKEVISYSINTGAAFVERTMGHELFYRYVTQFGFDALTGISLPGEVKGNVTRLKKDARDINFATASFGQGIAVTPLQLVNAVAAVANGGVLMKPILYADEKPTEVRRVIGKRAAREVAEILVSSVRQNVLAHIPQYTIAGKTGTAQIPDFKRGGYTDEFIHTYVGFAPALSSHARQFAILIRLDKPYGAPLAGTTVVPAFRELAEFVLQYYTIPPDDLEQ